MSVRSCILGGLAAIAAASAAPAFAAVRVLDFEDRDGTGVVLPNGYGGIAWGGAFVTYDTAARPFSPRSGTTAAYFNYQDGGMAPGVVYTRAFTFEDAVVFQGAWIAGDPVGFSFSFYLDGQFVGQSSATLSATSSFLAGPNAAIDEVRVTGHAGSFVIDDVTYDTDLASLAVPEPSTWALLIAGFGGAGVLLRRRRGVACAAEV